MSQYFDENDIKLARTRSRLEPSYMAVFSKYSSMHAPLAISPCRAALHSGFADVKVAGSGALCQTRTFDTYR